jgi:predicted esterase
MRSFLALMALAVPAQAQLFDVGVRYELGQRLRLFEDVLEKHRGDDRAIARAIPPVAAATPAFFSGRLAEAGEILDKARLSLASEKPDQAAVWASSVRFVPTRRVGEARMGQAEVRVQSFYKPSVKAPAKFNVRAVLLPEGRKAGISAFALDQEKLPEKLDLEWDSLPEGDHLLRCGIDVDKKEAFSCWITFSVVKGLAARIKNLEKSEALKKRNIEGATLAHHLDLLRKLERGDAQETDYPAHRLLTEAEALASGKWDGRRPGQYWLALPGVTGSPVRLLVPKEAANGKPLPVVVVMHGAGGSENMFFDGYGNGLAARLAAERGWFVVATRSPVLAFGGGPNVPAVLDNLASIHPIDKKRVFILGHSMGAAQTVQTVAKSPERFAAAAALGGGGTFKPTDGLKKVPFLVAVGEKDFLLKSARSLDASLRKAGSASTLKEMAHVEHLTVVQLALPEVFAFFSRVEKGG